jgi:hypothetical protein
MFTQIWKKYLPVIIILMKRSANGEQVLNMDKSDFNRAAGGRKIKIHFSTVHLNNGRITSLKDTPPVATDLVTLLQENDLSKKMIRGQQFELSMSSSFVLTIKNATPVAEAIADNTAEEPKEIQEEK